MSWRDIPPIVGNEDFHYTYSTLLFCLFITCNSFEFIQKIHSYLIKFLYFNVIYNKFILIDVIIFYIIFLLISTIILIKTN